ncbi:MAG TPA: mobile mystery protein A [Gammaproteobacteria bacterium]|jgi:predicted DNA-binding mobile mystery protein A
MLNEFTRLQIKQLDKQLEVWRLPARRQSPRSGWLRAIRHALGMSTSQFARRLDISQPRVLKLEKAEMDGSVTLASLRKAAHAMDCELVYAIVPREPIEAMVLKQADRVARAELESVGHTMALENQRPGRNTEARQLKFLREKLLSGPRRRLWK